MASLSSFRVMDPKQVSHELVRLASYLESSDKPSQERVSGVLRKIVVAMDEVIADPLDEASSTFRYSLHGETSGYGGDPYAVGTGSFRYMGVQVPAVVNDAGEVMIDFDKMKEDDIGLEEEEEAIWRQQYLDPEYDWDSVLVRLETDHGDKIRSEGATAIDTYTDNMISSHDTYD